MSLSYYIQYLWGRHSCTEDKEAYGSLYMIYKLYIKVYKYTYIDIYRRHGKYVYYAFYLRAYMTAETMHSSMFVSRHIFVRDDFSSRINDHEIARLIVPAAFCLLTIYQGLRCTTNPCSPCTYTATSMHFRYITLKAWRHPPYNTKLANACASMLGDKWFAMLSFILGLFFVISSLWYCG